MKNPLGIGIKIEQVSSEALDGATVFVRTITARDRSLATKAGAVDDSLYQARLLSFAICDNAGNRLYGESDIEDLANVPAAAADAIIACWMKLNGLRKEDAEEKQKNS